MGKEYSYSTELLIDLLVGSLEEEGCEVMRYSESKRHNTTAYECLSVKQENDYFSITIDKEKSLHPWNHAPIMENDTFDSLKEERNLKK